MVDAMNGNDFDLGLGWLLIIINIVYILLHVYISFISEFRLQRLLSNCNIALLVLTLMLTINSVFYGGVKIDVLFYCYLIALIISALTQCLKEK